MIVDDFQSEPDLSRSSSGAGVHCQADSPVEGLLVDGNLDFYWSEDDPMNGMTEVGQGLLPVRDADDSRGVVFSWSPETPASIEWEIPVDRRDLREMDSFAFRACQRSHHIETVRNGGPLSFTVSLRDRQGQTARLSTAPYGQIHPPYERAGGWANEFVTLRIPLADFRAVEPTLELGELAGVRFEFGSESGCERGALGIDDLEFLGRLPE